LPKLDRHISNLSTAPVNLSDRATFADLYCRFQPGLFFTALSLLSNQQDAEDVVTESFVKLWNARDGFNNLLAAGTWLRTTTRNACLDLLKSRKAEAYRLDELSKIINNGGDEDWRNEDLLGELLQEIYTAMESLPKKSRQVFRMRYVEGLKNEQIAEQLGIHHQSVRNHLFTALKTLRLMLLDKATLLPVLLLFLRQRD
jgi:RNA polymerase sigma-70 factor (ECF subfamily)